MLNHHAGRPVTLWFLDLPQMWNSLPLDTTALPASTALSAHTASSAPIASSGATAQPGNKISETTQPAPDLPEQGNSVSDDSTSVDTQSSSFSETSSDESTDETVWPAKDVRLVAILYIISNNFLSIVKA